MSLRRLSGNGTSSVRMTLQAWHCFSENPEPPSAYLKGRVEFQRSHDSATFTGTVNITRVPWPGFESMVNLPPRDSTRSLTLSRPWRTGRLVLGGGIEERENPRP